MKALGLLSATLLGVLAPGLAYAQGRPWLGDRGYGQGLGYRTGNLELHPGVAGEIGYDSNYFQRSGDGDTGADSPIESALRFRLTPSLSLSTLSPQRRTHDSGAAAPPSLNVRAGLSASYNELMGLGDADLSQQRNLEGRASFLLDVLPLRPVGADFSGEFARVAEASNDAAAVAAWNRDTVRLGAGASWRPGGGLFDWRLGYELLYNYFEQSAYQNLINANHTFASRGRWKFLPRTAAIFDAKTSWLYYTSDGAIRNSGQSIAARLGLHGLVTNRFSVLALAGWGATYFEPTAVPVLANFDSVIGQVEAKWYILPQPRLQPGAATVGLSSITVGYVRDFANSYLADYYQRDRLYTGLSYFVGGRYLIEFQAGYSRIAHPAFVRLGVTADAMSENRVDAQLFTEYRLSDSFAVNATLRYDGSLSDAWLTTPATTTQEAYTDNLAFSRVTAWLGVRWFL